MKIQNRNRATLLAIAGGYVLYLAYEMIRNQLNGGSSMPDWACYLAAGFFVIAGIAVLIYAWKVFRTKDEEEKEQKSQDETSSLK